MTDPKAKISDHFTYHEALYLPTWKRMADEADGYDAKVEDSLKVTFHKLDKVREYFGKPITVHVAYRPEAYNHLVHGAANSAHKFGMAVDFHVEGMTCDEVKKKILDDKMLDIWNMRMEDNGAGASWIHLDTRVPGPGGRFFKP
jgi:hypothetical protein